jgi:hypothetical protein
MFEFTDCWPSLEGLHLDSGSSTRLTYNANFNVGDVFVTAFGVNNNLSGASLLSSLESTAFNSLAGSATRAIQSFV